tara:strand:- start:52 stop:432 length:381 start_codon:yes stop_codon:yes gene_type:complete
MRVSGSSNKKNKTRMETYLYFAENLGADAAGDSAVYPASNFTGIDPISATTSRISFKALTGNAADDDILVTHASGKYKELCEGLATILNDDNGELVVVFDEDNSITHKLLLNLGVGISEIDITLDT